MRVQQFGDGSTGEVRHGVDVNRDSCRPALGDLVQDLTQTGGGVRVQVAAQGDDEATVGIVVDGGVHCGGLIETMHDAATVKRLAPLIKADSGQIGSVIGAVRGPSGRPRMGSSVAPTSSGHNHEGLFGAQTLRRILHTRISGSAARTDLSNAFGTAP
jgi:hypothetical protein